MNKPELVDIIAELSKYVDNAWLDGGKTIITEEAARMQVALEVLEGVLDEDDKMNLAIKVVGGI